MDCLLDFVAFVLHHYYYCYFFEFFTVYSFLQFEEMGKDYTSVLFLFFSLLPNTAWGAIKVVLTPDALVYAFIKVRFADMK